MVDGLFDNGKVVVFKLTNFCVYFVRVNATKVKDQMGKRKMWTGS